jgi:hypothetical protein
LITNYTATMTDQSTSVVVMPTTYWPNYKKLTVNGTEVKSGASQPVQLTAGAAKIEIAVTGNDGSTSTYTVQVQK